MQSSAAALRHAATRKKPLVTPTTGEQGQVNNKSRTSVCWGTQCFGDTLVLSCVRVVTGKSVSLRAFRIIIAHYALGTRTGSGA